MGQYRLPLLSILVIISALFLFSSEAAAQTRPKIVIWTGMSGTCKSSSTKLLTGNESIQCGEFGYGESNTTNVTLYKEVNSRLSQPFWHIDTIGLGDTRLIYNNGEIKKHIQKELIVISKEFEFDGLDAIIVTESYSGDVVSLRTVFKQLKDIFGYFPA